MTKSRKILILVKLHHICILALLFAQIVNTTYAKEEEDEDGDKEKEDDDDDPLLGTGAIIGLVLAIIALLIAVPIILCFCFGCMCFKPKEPKIIGVTPSATLRKQNRREAAAAPSTQEARVESSESRKESLVVVPESRRESNNTLPSAPGFSAYPLDDDPRAFYHNLGFEPPPPYIIGVDDNLTGMDIRYGEDAWADGEESAATSRFSSARPSAISVNEHGHGEKSRLGPSLIKGRIT